MSDAFRFLGAAVWVAVLLTTGLRRPDQGGYDWGFLVYSVGFGGSMIWFGSSAGVALSNMYPEARSVGQWLRHGRPRGSAPIESPAAPAAAGVNAR